MVGENKDTIAKLEAINQIFLNFEQNGEITCNQNDIHENKLQNERIQMFKGDNLNHQPKSIEIYIQAVEILKEMTKVANEKDKIVQQINKMLTISNGINFEEYLFVELFDETSNSLNNGMILKDIILQQNISGQKIIGLNQLNQSQKEKLEKLASNSFCWFYLKSEKKHQEKFTKIKDIILQRIDNIYKIITALIEQMNVNIITLDRYFLNISALKNISLNKIATEKQLGEILGILQSLHQKITEYDQQFSNEFIWLNQEKLDEFNLIAKFLPTLLQFLMRSDKLKNLKYYQEFENFLNYEKQFSPNPFHEYNIPHELEIIHEKLSSIFSQYMNGIPFKQVYQDITEEFFEQELERIQQSPK